ncbi:hypothetical protein C6497_07870 [Candidatus Poribacteria bacterium]|nr:MAG: hypothetical protein C6497_07870 [Candidatus Poribacteria bacterium]
MKTTNHLSLALIGLYLITLISIVGCSDVPYTGPVISVDHVDTYLNAIGSDTVCLNDGFDTVCVKLDLNKIEIDRSDIGYTPTVHVHPTNIAYMFEYEGRSILRAKRRMDTSELIQELEDAGRVNIPSSGKNLNTGNVISVPIGWTIEIYSTALMNVRVVEGLTIDDNTRGDLRIEDITEIDGGTQFAVDTKAAEITIQVKGLIPGNTATFHISSDSIDSDERTNILKLVPLQ